MDMREPPFPTRPNPYPAGLVELARERREVICLTSHLDLPAVQEALPERYLRTGGATAHMMSLAAALAHAGHIPYVHTYGTFATRRPYDQIANAIAHPALPVRIIGFAPGLTTSEGPGHQAVDDIALMRALPHMTVVDVAEATEAAALARAIVNLPGPVYVRLPRTDLPVLFEEPRPLPLAGPQILTEGADATVFATGTMVETALLAAATLRAAGVHVTVVEVVTLKPLDTGTVREIAARSPAVITAENHSVIGGLGSAVAETLAESGTATPLHRFGLRDTFAEPARTTTYLTEKYGLTPRHLTDMVWRATGRRGPVPTEGDGSTEAGTTHRVLTEGDGSARAGTHRGPAEGDGSAEV
ncbi:transketolase C-terminal domain-containing protein [Streptomyces sp. NPDC004610]|uniref:transketolase family protein n=1 Tax=unclassified Streptomyces TaxID=2593676 RepID=UPI0033AA86E5